MQTKEGHGDLPPRGTLIERIHAHYKHRGLGRLNVRGLDQIAGGSALARSRQ